MQRAEKDNGSANFASHCFPSIHEASRRSCAQHHEACHSFRPLYQFPNGKSVKGSGDTGDDHSSSGHPTIEEIRKKSFNKGFEAGKAEACKIVQKELDTPIRQFLDETDRYTHCFTQITDSHSNQIVRLALAVAKRVLGDAFQLDPDRHESMCRQMHSFLTRQYQLNVKFNCEDTQSLNELLVCVNPRWNQSPALNVASDVETQKGRINLIKAEETYDTSEGKFNQKIEEILAGNSKKIDSIPSPKA